MTGQARCHVTGMYATYNFRFAAGSRSLSSTFQSTFSATWAVVIAASQAAAANRAFRKMSPPFFR